MLNFFKTTPKNYQDIPSGEFHDLMIQPNTVIIDVRSAGEFAGGKIRGARNLDIMSSDFSNQVKNLPKDKTYLVYCRSGNRSGQACEIMGDLGFEKVKNLKGGIMSWPFETV
ncbi:MAG: rhodanese-like domain-containing protein [Algoriphagus sp.]|uniref:rhodanese-like domain-containing protein n=1 Tax=Algoriphagus sp. TaxID=1872435 RepID=UPI0026233F8A|nr:rhodanese-like domain-containing protein [Algoriphagus sp.]MDG1276731.1 rhodanese-like domain-containing protein [Algoriphagus sp.]